MHDNVRDEMVFRRVLLRYSTLLLGVIALLMALSEPAMSQGAASDQRPQATPSDPKQLSEEIDRLQEQGRYYEALRLAERALALAKQATEVSSPTLAAVLHYLTALHTLATLSELRGDYDRAEQLYRRVLAILEKGRGPTDPALIPILESLAKLYHTREDYQRAEPIYQRVLALHERTVGAEHQDTTVARENLAALYRDQQNYARAEALFRQNLAVHERSAADPAERAEALINLGKLYQAKGDDGQAESLFRRALEIYEALGSEHPSYAAAHYPLANLYKERFDHVRATQSLERAVAILEKALGRGHPDVARTLTDLGNLYSVMPDYGRAESCYQRARDIIERARGPEHPQTAFILLQLATLHHRKGDVSRAERLYRQVLAVYENALGPDAQHPAVAVPLSNLAGLYHRHFDYARAEPLYQQALTIYEKVRGAAHPDVATMLSNLAMLYQAKGDVARVEPMLKRALAIEEQALGPQHPSTAITLTNLAWHYQEKHAYGIAEGLYQRALTNTEAAFGPEYPDIASILNLTAWLYERQGKIERSVELRSRANAIRERYLGPMLMTGAEEQKLAYMAQLASETDNTLSLHLQSGPGRLAAARLALTTVLRRKGRVLDVMTESIASLRRRLTGDDRGLLDQLLAVRTRLAHLVIEGRGHRDPRDYQAKIQQLNSEAETLEAQLSARSAEFRAQAQPVTLEHVQAAIPPGAALVELVAYRPVDLQATRAQETWGPSRYAAYVLHSQGEPLWIDLGEAAAIDRSIDDLRRGLSDPETTYVARVARKLDEQVMRPVRQLLGDARAVLLSPDGALNLIPFGALVDEESRYLLERYRFTYLTSGRDLLQHGITSDSRGPPLIIANPDFGATTDVALPHAVQLDRGSRERRSRDLASGEFRPLPGTLSEAQTIQAMLPDAKLLSGAQATESALKQVTGPRLLHVATHGFFLPDLTPRSRPTPSLLLNPPGFPEGLNMENPLLRSGLAFAGANRLQSGQEDGLLTALEASSLDLWGTKLVVLSACETGVGAVQNAEGVYGLRRALVIAGSRSQVISLWKVSDEATHELMVSYYRHLIAGERSSEALRQAQLDMRLRKERSHPYYWASFIPSGASFGWAER